MDSKGVMGEEPVGPSMSEGYGDEAFCASLSADAERPACRQIVALYGDWRFNARESLSHLAMEVFHSSAGVSP